MRSIISLPVIVALVSCGTSPVDAPKAESGRNQAVVFDIDGTLTPRRSNFVEARADAATTAQSFYDKGYTVYYISARSSLTKELTQSWLNKNRFPPGFLYLGQLPTDAMDSADYKIRILETLIKVGWRLEYAYGDQSTDFEAYAKVNIPKDRIFALQRSDENICEPGLWTKCLKGWTEHLDFITNSVQSISRQ